MKPPIKKRDGLFVELRRNAAAGAVALAALGIGIEQVAHHAVEPDWLTISKVMSSLAEAMIVAAFFGFLFEFFGRKRLIEEAVEQAAGQVRATTFGLYNFVTSPSEIDYKESFATSSTLVISARYSADAIIPYRDQLIDRFNDGKCIIFIRAKPAAELLEGVTKSTSTTQSALDFFKDLIKSYPKFKDLIDFRESERPFTYNFVAIDDGIWVKLYYNARSNRAPPAFFTKRKTPLHLLYMNDINDFVNGASKVKIETLNQIKLEDIANG